MAGLALAGPVTTGTDYVDSGGRHFLNYSYDFTDDGGAMSLAGRVFVPDNYDPAKKYPLVVFYQGNSQGGGDNIKNVVPNGTDELANLRVAAQTNGFFLYLPQPMQTTYGWYYPGSGTAGLNMDMTMLQVANLQNSYNIDREKLYLTGFSMGGHAVWSMGGIHAGAIGALFPVDPNGGGVAASNAAQLVSKPIWGWHRNGDNADGIRSAHIGRMAQIRNQDGGKAAWPILSGTYNNGTYSNDFVENGLRYSEIVATGHSCNWAYGMSELFPWLLVQKNQTGWMRTGEKICFDFGSQQVASTTGTDTVSGSNIYTYTRPDSSGTAWNSSVANYGNNYGAAFAFAKTTTGRSTLASLYVIDKFTDYNRTAATSTLFDANIGKDGWMSPVSGTGTIQLQGLTPGGAYKVEIFATTEQTGGAYTTTAYTIGTTVRPLTVLNNASTKATFASVTADPNGKITLSVSGTSGSTYGMIATLELTALNAGGVAAPQLTDILSRKTQGANVWNLPIYESWTNTSIIESRQPTVSGSHQLVFSFDQPVTGGTVSVVSGTATVSGISFAGSQMTVNLTNASDIQYLTLKLSNIQGIGSVYNGISAVGLLCGDVDGNLTVNSTDLSQVTSWYGWSILWYLFLNDVNCDGLINTTDQSLVTSKLGHQLSAYELPPEYDAEDVTAEGAVFGTINPPTGGGSKFISTICNGVMPAVGNTSSSLQYDTCTSVLPRIPVQCYGYTFTGNKAFTALVFQEGKHFVDGGWWANGSLKVQVRQSGTWTDVDASVSPPYPVGDTQATFGPSYETYTFTFNTPVVGDGIQITGTVGGSILFTSIGELRAWASTPPSQNLATSGTAFGTINPPKGGQGNKFISTIYDGVKPAVGGTNKLQQYDTFTSDLPRIAAQSYGYTFSANKTFTAVVFQEGIHFVDGGWWANGSLKVQVRQSGTWVDVAATVNPAYPNGNTQAAFGQNYETYTFTFNNPVIGDAIQITGTVGGSAQFTSIGELEVWGY